MTHAKTIYIVGFCVLAVITTLTFFFVKNFSSFGMFGEFGEKQSQLLQEVMVQDLIVGTGAVAQKGQKVLINYIARLENNTIFETSPSDHPFSFILGDGQVLPGLDKGMYGMQVGGVRIITIPPELGYGSKGKQGVVPPNTTLIYQVEFLNSAEIEDFQDN